MKTFRKFSLFRWKFYFRKNRKIENVEKIEKSHFFQSLFFSWKFRFPIFVLSIFQNFRFFENIFFTEKVNILETFSLFNFLSYLMPKYCQWHRATPSVPPVGAANVSSKIRKIMFFDDFSLKNDANELLIRPNLALRSGFEARPTSNGPSSELKWSYEDFRSTLINN